MSRKFPDLQIKILPMRLYFIHYQFSSTPAGAAISMALHNDSRLKINVKASGIGRQNTTNNSGGNSSQVRTEHRSSPWAFDIYRVVRYLLISKSQIQRLTTPS